MNNSSSIDLRNIKIVAIAAMDLNRAIGLNNQLPWHVPADLEFYKKRTRGGVLIMGRKTCQSLKKPLPGRVNIVLTLRPDFMASGFQIVHSKEEALKLALIEAKNRGLSEIIINGGTEIYKLFLPETNVIELTVIQAEMPKADSFFPDFPHKNWSIKSENIHKKDALNPYDCHFQTWVRKE